MYMIHVFLADNEWGNELMSKIAAEVINEHKDKELLVHVYEHGGWHLDYAMLDGEVKVVGTANDQAVFSPAVKAFWNKLNSEKCEMLPSIRRNDLVKEKS